MNTRERFSRELGETLSLAAPIVVGQLSQMAMNVTDSVMIGHVGTVPLAASAFAGTVFGMFYILGIGLLMPVAVLVSHARGANDPVGGQQLLRHGVALAGGFSLLEIAVMLVIGQQLHHFGQAPEVVAVVGPYFAIIAFSILPVLVFQVVRQFAESLGQPWVPMAIMMASVLLNVVLNWLLIYGHWGLPAMGLTGAGWATLVSRVAALGALFYWLKTAPRLAEWWPPRWRGELSRRTFAEMFRLGVPASGQLLFEGGAFTAAAIMVGWLGAVPLAAHQIAISCASMTFMFTLGISSAASMRIGHVVGAREFHRLRPIGFGALAAGLGCMSLFALVFLFCGKWLASYFVVDPAVIQLAATLLLVAAVFQIFDGAQVIGAGMLRGLKDIRIPTAITFVAYWMIALPGGYAVGIRGGLGAVGVWAALAAGLAFAGVFLVIRFVLLTKTGRVERLAAAHAAE